MRRSSSERCSNSNHVLSHLSHNPWSSYVYLSYSLSKVKIRWDIKWSYRSPPMMLTIASRMVENFEHTVQSFFNTCFFISVLRSTLNHSPIKNRCLFKMRHRLKLRENSLFSLQPCNLLLMLSCIVEQAVRGSFLNWPQFMSVLTLSLTSFWRAFHWLLNVTHNYTLLPTADNVQL